MDTENIIVNDSQGTAEPTAEPAAAEVNDAQITIDALKEVIAENRSAMEQLRSELAETKKVNAKLLARLDVSKGEPSADDVLNSLFNKYERR